MSVGCAMLIFSHDLISGTISRMLMGLGGSFAFIGAIYLGRSWFSVALFPIIVGLTEAMSGVGSFGFNAIFSGSLLAQSWRIILAEVTISIVVLAILTQLFVRGHNKKSSSTVSKKRLKQSTKILFRKVNVWIIALYTGFGFVHYITLTSMWEVQFLIQQYKIPTFYAVLENSLVILGFVIGGPLCGLLARYNNYLKIMMAGALLQVVFLMMIHYFNFNIVIESVCLFSLGLSTGSIILCFEAVRKETPKAVYGVASGFINMFFAGFSILVSPLIGYLYQTTSDLQLTVFPVIFCSIVSVLFCFALILRKQGTVRKIHS